MRTVMDYLDGPNIISWEIEARRFSWENAKMEENEEAIRNMNKWSLYRGEKRKTQQSIRTEEQKGKIYPSATIPQSSCNNFHSLVNIPEPAFY